MLNHELVPVLCAHQASNDLLREQYGVDLSEAELLKDNFNLVYASGPFIIRISPASKKGLAEIRAELKWLSFLMARDISVNRVIPTASGENYLRLEVEGDKLYCVVFGREKENKVQESDWTKVHFQKLGALTGRLHQASIDFQEEVDKDFIHWHEQSKAASFNYLPNDDRKLSALHHLLHEKIMAQPRTANTYGVIHYDIHHGNYFLLRDQPGTPLLLFDFEMTCRGWFLQDIAVILYYASNRNTTHNKTPRHQFEQDFLSAFQTGYAKYLPELVFDWEVIQTHLLYRDLFVYGFVLEAWRGRELSEGDLRFLALLEANIAERRLSWEESLS
ncbi:MAG: phosphotransferase [Bacteroidota bacterium]